MKCYLANRASYKYNILYATVCKRWLSLFTMSYKPTAATKNTYKMAGVTVI